MYFYSDFTEICSQGSDVAYRCHIVSDIFNSGSDSGYGMQYHATNRRQAITWTDTDLLTIVLHVYKKQISMKFESKYNTFIDENHFKNVCKMLAILCL